MVKEIRWNDLNPDIALSDFIVLERKIEYAGSVPDCAIVVEYGQVALVYEGDEFVSMLTQATHPLKMIMNKGHGKISLLSSLLAKKETKTICIYFVNLMNFREFAFGTPSPITLEDAYSMAQIRIRVAGNYDLSLNESNSRQFLETTGMRPSLLKKDLADFFKETIIKGVSECLVNLNNEYGNVCDAVSNFTNTASDILVKKFSPYFENYGLRLSNLKIAFANILPEDMQYLSGMMGMGKRIAAKEEPEEATITESVQEPEVESVQNEQEIEVASEKESVVEKQSEMVENTTQQPYQPQTPPPIQPISFYVAVNGQSYGPYDMNALTQMFTNGTLTRQTLVWKQGMANWAPVTMVAELQNIFSVPPIPNMPPQY